MEGQRHHHFVMIHGACHGAWCWYKLATLLEKAGHTVTCLDLAGAGLDRSNPDSITTFDAYTMPLTRFMQALPHPNKVVLVGHSTGGLSVTHAIHRFGDKIEVAIYVAATMLRCGFITDQDYQDAVPKFMEHGDVHVYNYALGRENPPTSAMFKKELLSKVLYNRSPEEDSTLSSMLIKPAPLVFHSAKFDSGEHIDKVRRVYIKTTHDNVVKPSQQEAMINKWAPSEVFALDTDHSPFFSAPFELYAAGRCKNPGFARRFKWWQLGLWHYIPGNNSLWCRTF